MSAAVLAVFLSSPAAKPALVHARPGLHLKSLGRKSLPAARTVVAAHKPGHPSLDFRSLLWQRQLARLARTGHLGSLVMFVIQGTGRAATYLLVLFLELHIIAHVLCAVPMYLFWVLVE